MLPPANDDLQRRRWGWQQLSDLFLDEETTEDMLRNIARVAADCGYTDEELDDILRNEVAPAVAFNFFDTAGTWGYFDTVWLEGKILHSSRLGYWFHRLIVVPLVMLALRQHWEAIKMWLVQERERVRREKASQGDRWKPCCSEPAPVYRWASPDEIAAMAKRK